MKRRSKATKKAKRSRKGSLLHMMKTMRLRMMKFMKMKGGDNNNNDDDE